MIIEAKYTDLNLLADHFTTCGDYTKEVILEELEYHRTLPDFLCLISVDNTILFPANISGFLIGYRNRNSLWIAQVWRKPDGDLSIGKKAIEMAKSWAKERCMTSITFETIRNESNALKRYGFVEDTIIMKMQL